MNNTFLFLALFSTSVFAQQTPFEAAQAPTGPVTPIADAQITEKGWWFYDDPVKEEEEEYIYIPPKAEPQTAKQEEQQPEKDPCQDVETWTVDCGFVDPGKSFEFQAKQRDELLESMVMSPNDYKTVEAFQYYMKWMFDQAVELGNTWYYNRMQNPELDPQAAQPISSFGLKLASQVKENRSAGIYKAIAEDGGMLIFFTRSDCSYCHSMKDTILGVARDTGIEVWNASLDEQCLDGFENCMVAPETHMPASALQISVVPSLVLYVKPNTWIRLSNGVSDQQTIKSRMVNFFSAYRAALVKGADNGKGMRPAMDFSASKPEFDGNGLGRGVKADPDATINEADVKSLLSKQLTK